MEATTYLLLGKPLEMMMALGVPMSHLNTLGRRMIFHLSFLSRAYHLTMLG